MVCTETEFIEFGTSEEGLGEELARGSEATEHRLDVGGVSSAQFSYGFILVGCCVLIVRLRRGYLEADVAHLGQRVLHLVEVGMLIVVLLHLAIAGLSSGVSDLSGGGTHEGDATTFLADGELTVYIVDLIGTSEQSRELLLETL